MKFSFPVRIYLVALVLRLIPVLLARNLGIGLDDMFQYDMLARSLASGHGYRWYAQTDLRLIAPYVHFDLATAKGYDPAHGLYTSFRAPLYPVFLSIVYFVNGTGFSRFFAARLAQAILLGAPLAPLTYLVSTSLFAESDGASRAAAWIVAAYPMLLVYPLGLGTENPFFLLLLCAFLFLLRCIQNPSRWNLLLAGVFLALTALTRSVILPFAVLSIAYLVFLHRKPALLSGLAFVLVVTPWIIRNSLLHHKLTGIETSMGYNLYLGYHPLGNGSFVFGPSLDLLTIMDDSERDAIGTQKAMAFIRAEPERFIPLAVNRLGFFFGLEKRVLMYFYSNDLIGFIPGGALLTFASVLLLPFVVICLLAAFSLPRLNQNPGTILLAILFAAYILPHVFILAEDRFHLALVPFITMLAVQGARYVYDLGAGMKVNWTRLLVSAALVLLLLANWGFELHRDADKIAVLLGPAATDRFIHTEAIMKYLLGEKIALDWKTVTITVVSTLLLMIDYYHKLTAHKYLDRIILYLIIPLLLILVLFRENPVDYGFSLGDWKLGIAYTLAGLLVMAPIIYFLGRADSSMKSYYHALLPGLPWTTFLDLFGWEFFFRGWILFGYLRRFGHEALWLQAVPFALAHISKPEIETLSTIFGGFAFGWVAWRTRSFVWPFLIHWFIGTFIILVAAGSLG